MSSGESHHGQGLFLVMDDEAAVRQTVAAFLSSLGYTVVARENGEETLEFFRAARREGKKLTAMIFDLTIRGGMGGLETIAAIRREDPEIPVFVMSGYAEDPVMGDPAAFGFTASLRKPFLLAELVKTLGVI